MSGWGKPRVQRVLSPGKDKTPFESPLPSTVPRSDKAAWDDLTHCIPWVFWVGLGTVIWRHYTGECCKTTKGTPNKRDMECKSKYITKPTSTVLKD